ncbi:MAG: hypothetical protein JOZ46_10500 [Candidatus Dormibacteraeota bacterium]|nr:hypothetical protein [Candidatus Dormibacteraeota bacterium]MBV9526229.1 hypothetical protein [Candidatus Dormibacteraeota bacterium]
MNATPLITLDEAGGSELQRCAGPATDGSCPRVAIGHLLPCAGHVLIAAAPDALPYTVPGRATLCPVTLASALAVPSDTTFNARG